MAWQNRSSPPFRYQVAGMQVITNRTAADCNDLTRLEGSVRVMFVSQEVNPGASGRQDNEAQPEEEWHFLPDGVKVGAFVSADGRAVLIHEPDDWQLDHAAQLRRVIPFAAALQGKIILHASAILQGGTIIALMGASSTGKSTLARQLGTMGYPIVADDLLPCHINAEGTTVPTAGDPGPSTGAPAEEEVVDRPLGALYFLSRNSCRTEPILSRLTKKECLQELLQHGFGELPVAALWQTQFVAYHQVAQQVPGFRFEMPDDLGRLAESAITLSRHFASLAIITEIAGLRVERRSLRRWAE